MNPRFFERDLSWLAFNDRVLQEAMDPSVPLYERIRFLAIWSSNLDEFFRVRVASLRSLLRLKSKGRKELGRDPAESLARIHAAVDEQQVRFGQIFRHQIAPELAENGVHLVTDVELDAEQVAWVRAYLDGELPNGLEPTLLDESDGVPFLTNRHIYLLVRLARDGAEHHGLVRVPTDRLPRFLVLPQRDERTMVMFLDDAVRLVLPYLFGGHTIAGAYAIKLTRDAELYIDDEYAGDLLEKIKKALHKRSDGAPSRFLFDTQMPERSVRFIRRTLALEKEDMVLGGRYHNLHDLFTFPNPGIPESEYASLPAIAHPAIDRRPMFASIAERDIMLHFPYHSYDGVLRFIEEAAADPAVTTIKITLYRVAARSGIIAALVDAARRGKEVTAFVEVKARFDEESNLSSADELQRAGVRVLYSFPGLKVHSKLCLVERIETKGITRYAYLGTGNFNEKTARIYTDHGLLTADERLTGEVAEVFEFLGGAMEQKRFRHLLVAPFNMRARFVELIAAEIANARAGKPSGITLKMNSLEDSSMIKRLYEASQAGVPIRIIVRGICCLVPGVKGLSDRITVTSIVDRYLEHARVYIFENDGDEQVYVASADWMTRNLSRRVEVGFPIRDPAIRSELRAIIDLQLADSSKARIIDRNQTNAYVRRKNAPRVRAQDAIYRMLLVRAVPDETSVEAATAATRSIVGSRYAS
jgi:polyphosphate kinase